MPNKTPSSDKAADIFTEMLQIQGEAARQVMQSFAPEAADSLPGNDVYAQMGKAMLQLQEMWLGPHFPGNDKPPAAPLLSDPKAWMDAMQSWSKTVPLLDMDQQQRMWSEGMGLWQQILEQYNPVASELPDNAKDAVPKLPRKDRRFADPAWSDQPVFALIHQTYLLFAERIAEAVDTADGLSDDERTELRFATQSVLDAMSPANYPMMNPVVLERTVETGGDNLLRGMERLQHDLEKGQLTHTDTSKFTLGENVAATPGKVIYETDLYQIIHYTPTTDKVIETPLLIFPPWINRYYILDLNPKKSFVRWAVEQGLSVLLVSWRSADESLGEVDGEAYIRAQMEAIDVVRERLKVPSVHTIGYCVAGTNLAASLAVLAQRGEADKVASVTFLTAQVDFERAGELRMFIDDAKLEMVRQASKGGFLDGRYMAATFNMLRGSDLIWNYVVNHYLLGEDYPAFDLLYWNGDVTNLPAKWHACYLQDYYKDNKLVQPGALSVDGTPIDLRKVKTPAYVQAGKEDHIAPAQSVFRIQEHLSGPIRFVLAGSGHIAGVVNPPAANKYQYWTCAKPQKSLESFVAKAKEHPGSWWPDWFKWIEKLDKTRVAAKGRRVPGGRGNKALEDAPGRYVRMR